MATFRYLVNDVGQSITFYCENLGFTLEEQYGPAMAIIKKDDLELWLAGPASSAAKSMPDGSKPVAGGWSRIVLQVDGLAARVETLKSKNVKFRNDITRGPGGEQILCEDPSGNVIELFDPA